MRSERVIRGREARVRRLITLVAAASVVTCGVDVAAPAHAYDTDAYAYAAGHMIHLSDIPSTLGAFKKGLNFNASPSRNPSYLCTIPTSDPNRAPASVQFPSGRYAFVGGYDGKGKNDQPSLSVQVGQYSSAEKAIAAFDAAKKRITKCTGSGSSTYTDPDTGSVSTYSSLVTNGVVPAVTTTGVESIFVSQNNLSVTTPGDARFINDSYTVISLLDDVVISTTYYLNTNDNITTKQRKAVNQVAFNAETAWLG